MHSRKPPARFEVPPALPLRAGLSLELDVSVTTPMYGGGAVPGYNDAFDPFRIPSIRGHLRFWWRATRGGVYGNADELRLAEAKIWGAMEVASPVKLRMLNARAGAARPAVQPRPDGSGSDYEEPRYVLFPAQEDRQRAGRIYVGGSFRIEIQAPESLIPEVDSALWAWFAFGGIGGRTRRGCGSLYCVQYANTWKAECMAGTGQRRHWPTLRGGTAVMGSRKRPWIDCWRECADMLMKFRQNRPAPRARSRWPEPDEIRRIRGRHSSNHAPVNTERGFPRAALGLPIVFHFKTPGDPEQNTLNMVDPDDKELRMASPAIVKPFAVSATEAIPLLLILNTPSIRDAIPGARLVLKEKTGLTHSVEALDASPVLHKLVLHARDHWRGEVYPL